MEAIGEEGDEDVRLDPRFVLVEDRTNGEIAFQILEGLYEYRTGLTPAISYGPNRRIGAMGAYVITVDLKTKQLVPASGWIGVN